MGLGRMSTNLKQPCAEAAMAKSEGRVRFS